MEKLLSIIVPVYKVEAYINKCLDSLVMDETDLMERLEVIIVNDGTPDRSAEMSREYVKRYPGTFRQIDKENGGHGSAWNVGLKEATGKYIRFLDSDDWFTNLERLLIDLGRCGSDIVFNPFVKYYSDENRSVIIETPTTPGTADFPKTWGCNNVNFWGTTYKTDILKPLLPLFAEGVMYDDFILTWAPLVYGNSCYALDYVVYNYLIGRKDQTMNATRQRRGAVSYVKCFDQYELVRSRVDTLSTPPHRLDLIDSAIKRYAYYIFTTLIYLPYREAKEKSKYLWDKYIADSPNKSQLEKRFDKLPFSLFYSAEHLRRSLLHR